MVPLERKETTVVLVSWCLWLNEQLQGFCVNQTGHLRPYKVALMRENFHHLITDFYCW